MSEVKKCPKCGREMATGILPVQGNAWEIYWRVERPTLGENIVASRCRKCGYADLGLTKFPQGEK